MCGGRTHALPTTARKTVRKLRRHSPDHRNSASGSVRHRPQRRSPLTAPTAARLSHLMASRASTTSGTSAYRHDVCHAVIQQRLASVRFHRGRPIAVCDNNSLNEMNSYCKARFPWWDALVGYLPRHCPHLLQRSESVRGAVNARTNDYNTMWRPRGCRSVHAGGALRCGRVGSDLARRATTAYLAMFLTRRSESRRWASSSGIVSRAPTSALCIPSGSSGGLREGRRRHRRGTRPRARRQRAVRPMEQDHLPASSTRSSRRLGRARHVGHLRLARSGESSAEAATQMLAQLDPGDFPCDGEVGAALSHSSERCPASGSHSIRARAHPSNLRQPIPWASCASCTRALRASREEPGRCMLSLPRQKEAWVQVSAAPADSGSLDSEAPGTTAPLVALVPRPGTRPVWPLVHGERRRLRS